MPAIHKKFFAKTIPGLFITAVITLFFGCGKNVESVSLSPSKVNNPAGALVDSTFHSEDSIAVVGDPDTQQEDSVETEQPPVLNPIKVSDSIQPYDLNGTWMGFYTESSVICTVLMRMQMNVTITGKEFQGIITATDVAGFPVTILTGLLNGDSSELTLQPDGTTMFENPWRIAGKKISGAIQSDMPLLPDTIIVKRRYEFAKQ